MIGLLAWLYLGARIVVYAAEINVVLTRGCGRGASWTRPSPPTAGPAPPSRSWKSATTSKPIEVAFHPPDKQRAPDPRHPQYSVAPAPRPARKQEPMAPPVGLVGLDLRSRTADYAVPSRRRRQATTAATAIPTPRASEPASPTSLATSMIDGPAA